MSKTNKSTKGTKMSKDKKKGTKNNKLSDALNFSDDLEEAHSISEPQDIMELLKPYLYLETIDILNNKVTQLSGVDYDVRYIGFKGSTFNTDGSIKRLARDINETCSAFKVKGCLGTPVQFPLWNDTFPNIKSVYVCYLAFSKEAARVIDNLISSETRYPFLKEGEMPE